MYKPKLKGGSVEYTVDVSGVESGCVASLYFAKTGDQCTQDPASGANKNCSSVKAMEANVHGFNTSGNPCKNGECDAESHCQARMRKEGIEKYGKGAYGKGGSLIDTNRNFRVKTEFVSLKNYTKFYKLRTTLTQSGR